MSNKIKPWDLEDREYDGVYFYNCPGCKCIHRVWTKKINGKGAIWSFNGNVEKPTFSPSIMHRGYLTENDKDGTCHCFITDGNIQFLTDCTHELAGQTVPLQDIEV